MQAALLPELYPAVFRSAGKAQLQVSRQQGIGRLQFNENAIFSSRLTVHQRKISAVPCAAVENYILSFLLPFATGKTVQRTLAEKKPEGIIRLQQKTRSHFSFILQKIFTGNIVGHKMKILIVILPVLIKC